MLYDFETKSSVGIQEAKLIYAQAQVLKLSIDLSYEIVMESLMWSVMKNCITFQKCS